MMLCPGADMSLTQAERYSTPVKSLVSAVVWLLVFVGTLQAGEKIAVFELEIVRSGDIAGAPERIEAETKRLAMITERLRGHIAASGQFDLIDTAPVAAKAAAANLQYCGNCADVYARELGANYAVTGTVHKISELILNINVQVHDAAAEQAVAAANVDLRGNTDESWRRGIDYLYENVLSPRLRKLMK